MSCKNDNDYFPGGMLMPGRKFTSSSYRFGFNGKENDDEVKGEGNQQDYGMRIYDPRLVRFLSVDPLSKQYPWYSPFQFAGNKPIWAVDLDGLEEAKRNVYIERKFNVVTAKEIELIVVKIEDVKQEPKRQYSDNYKIIVNTKFEGGGIGQMVSETRNYMIPIPKKEELSTGEKEAKAYKEDFELKGYKLLPEVDIEAAKKEGAKATIEKALPGVTTEKVIDMIDKFEIINPTKEETPAPSKIEERPSNDEPKKPNDDDN